MLQHLWWRHNGQRVCRVYRSPAVTELEELRLGGTQVSDAGLERLKGMTKLNWLELGRTQVTEAGINELQQALTNCKIQY